VRVDLTEPNITKNFVRNGFIMFEDAAAVEALMADRGVIKVSILSN
jgi:hypothetical protein